MTRSPIMVGNWKMNLGPAAACTLAKEICQSVADAKTVTRILCPSFPVLAAVRDTVAGTEIQTGARNCHAADQGAYTGEVSCTILKELVSHVIIGHSERRTLFGETDRDVNQKVTSALAHGLVPIICVGEDEIQNAEKETRAVVTRQVTTALNGLSCEEASRVILAYEPVWAIGTGKAASDRYAGEVCGDLMRLLLADLYNAELAVTVPILYGGSTNPSNIEAFMAQPDVDGALIGGASLSSKDYSDMVSLVA